MAPSTGFLARRPAEWITAALAALVLGSLMPLGLASGEAVDLAANALGARRSLTEATPLCDLLARLAVLMPIGEVGARPHALAALGGMVGLALLVARLRLLAPRLRSLVPSGATAAVAAGAIVVAVSRPFLAVATLRADLALDFAMLSGIALLLESLRRDPARSSVGLGLAFLSGLAAGASWPVRATAWPLGVALTVWALRRGQRWPLMAPTAFVAGAGIWFGAVVSAAALPPPTAGTMFHQIVFSLPQGMASLTARAALASAANDVGVLALLVAAIGCAVLLLRARAETILWMLVWVGAAVASFADADIELARLVLVAALAAPIAAAVAAMAESFGRARVAAARVAATIVMTVVVALTPAFVGIGSALTTARRAAPGAVARRLDAALDRLTTSDFAPTDTAAARWRRYARAVAPPSDN
jgi:hypothetical protein